MDKNFNNIDKKIIDAARRGDKDAVLSNLSNDDRKKINGILADKKRLEEVLKSDAAQKIMKILGGNNNG